MGIWLHEARAGDDEHELFRAAANQPGRFRSIGGQLLVTDRHVIFEPNRLDNALGAHRLSIARSSITHVTVTPGGRNAIRRHGIGASLRPQVTVTYQPAESTAFTVREPEKLAAALGPLPDRHNL